MTAPGAWIPGYAGKITIATNDLTVVGNVYGQSSSRAVMPKPVFGRKTVQKVGGQVNHTLSASGHVAKSAPIGYLWTALESETPVAIEVTVGADTGSLEAGKYTGNAYISQLDINADAEGEWEWSMTLDVDGDWTFTPPTVPPVTADETGSKATK